MVDLLELLVFLVVGIAGLVQWLQQRKRPARPKPTASTSTSRRRHAAVRAPRPAPAPSPPPVRTSTQPSPEPTQLPEIAEPASPSLEDILSELFGGEPVSIPPRPLMRVPPRPRKIKPAPTPTVIQPAEQPEGTSAPTPPPALSLTPTPTTTEPLPTQPSSLTSALRHLRSADWQLAIVLHEILSPPVSLR